MDEQNKPDSAGAAAGESRRRFLARSAIVGSAAAALSSCKTTQTESKEDAAMPIIGRCGYRCDLCAARSDDRELRQKMVDGWRKYWGHERYTADNVRCDGCLVDGRLADTNCGVRPCVIEKGIPNCAHCDECPCDKLKRLLSSPHMNFARFGEVPEEDYNLCMRQFDSIPELMRIRKELKGG
jgi:hypothetical protein